MKKTVKTGAWLTNDYTTIDELVKMSQEELVHKLNCYDLDGNIPGWTLVGTAEVSITLDAPDKMIANKVDALKVELTKTKADAEAKCNFILGQINNLLSIEFKPEGKKK
jgi:hypothetical protein